MIRAAFALGLGLVLAGCAGNRVEDGTFHSVKGYRIGLPGNGWQVAPSGEADLRLTRAAPSAGMLADATCDGGELDRPLPVLARHLTFGLTDRVTVQSDTWTVDGHPAAHRVIHGTRNGVEVGVEAVVLKGERCIHDFLYVAPLPAFDEGRRDFRAFVDSFAGETR